MDYRKFVFQINSTNYVEGCGVIVDDLFITAGHVIEMSLNPNVEIEGERYPLVEDEALYIDTNKTGSCTGYDLAIFRFKEVNSPLLLTDIFPSEGDQLLSCSYKTLPIGSSYQECLGKVMQHYENYFECNFETSLSEGSSGSPVFDGEKVVGILYGDREGKESSNKVLFLSASAIMKLLKGIGYKKQ